MEQTVDEEASGGIQHSSRLRAGTELLAFIAMALILKELMDPLSSRYSGPVSLLTTLGALTLYMHRRGEHWSSMGLGSLSGVRAKFLVVPQAALIFVAVVAITVLVTKGFDALGMHFLSEPIEGEQERWGDIEGNLRMYLILLGLSWVSAGFGEEMFFRGFLMTRLETFLHDTRFASLLVVVLPALLFGYVHVYYQGLAGFVNAGVIGLIFGSFFLLYKRNLWPLVVAHGFINSIAFTAEFMGLTI